MCFWTCFVKNDAKSFTKCLFCAKTSSNSLTPAHVFRKGVRDAFGTRSGRVRDVFGAVSGAKSTPRATRKQNRISFAAFYVFFYLITSFLFFYFVSVYIDFVPFFLKMCVRMLNFRFGGLMWRLQVQIAPLYCLWGCEVSQSTKPRRG